MTRHLMPTALLAVGLTLGGCATNTALYNWGPYEDQVYAHFKNESPEEQILILEKHAQETQASGRQLPPGFRAHLGLLYSKVGREGEFVMALEQEKAVFPESATYVDNLLASTRARKEAPNGKR